jgi:hypothetical protein
MPWPPHPIAQTSYPRDAQTKEEEGPKTFDDHDFSWEEDWLTRWRAIALFGGLVLVEGLVLWMTIPQGLGGGLFGLSLLVGVCGIPASFLGASEVSMAFFGAAATGIAVWFFSPLTAVPAGSSLFADIGSSGADSAVVLGLLLAGTLLLAVGVVESVRTYRALDDGT